VGGVTRETSFANRARAKPRIVGLDAARGIALIGMMAIHVLPETTDDFEPTVAWTVASGTSAALFALLAGVGLAVGTGIGPGAGARDLAGARASLAMRAAGITVIGLLLGQIDIPAAVILAYYGMMFALAIPLLGLGALALAGWAVGFATIGALATWLLAGSLPGLAGFDPSLSFLVADPGGTLSALLFTGNYPAIPWMAFLCAGLAIGQLDVRSADTQLRIFLTGLFLAAGTALFSALLLGPLGGKEQLVAANRRWFSAEHLEEVIIWGPVEGIPMASGWWQVTLSPHSGTVLEVMNTLGVAMAVLGAILFIGERVHWAMAPLAVLGSMTLTLYSLHLLFLATGIGEDQPSISLWVQVGAGLSLAVLWRNISGRNRGPLEHVISRLAGGARDRVLDKGHRSG
jgi:uncharacterized membrane protein